MRIMPDFAVVRPSVVPYVGLAGLQAGDVATTYAILRWFASGLDEGNPIVATLFSSVGLAVGCLMLLVLKLVVVHVLWACQTKVRLASALYGAVVVNNFLLLAVAVAQ